MHVIASHVGLVWEQTQPRLDVKNALLVHTRTATLGARIVPKGNFLQHGVRHHVRIVVVDLKKIPHPPDVSYALLASTLQMMEIVHRV